MSYGLLVRFLEKISKSLLALSLFIFVASAAHGQQGTVVYRVTADAAAGGDGMSWDSPVTLETALQRAGAGDEIWVKGYDESAGTGVWYVAPEGGFRVKSGVKLYGGFFGDEQTAGDRQTLEDAASMKYRSVLTGDVLGDDMTDESFNVHMIFPTNPKRADNRTRVVVMDLDNAASDNRNNAVTVLDGFTIGGGHAVGAETLGGGVFVHNSGSSSESAYRIQNCFFVNNYALDGGGAVYVDASVGGTSADESWVTHCIVFNNAAGERTVSENVGGGIYLAGAGTVANTAVFNNENGGIVLSADASVVNSTVARNTGAGIDAAAEGQTPFVYNTVIWGNTTLFAQHAPGFRHSAYHEDVQMDGGSGNVMVADKNNDSSASSPFFASPSVRTSFDRDFDWTETAYPLWQWDILEGSAFIDKGNSSYFTDIFGTSVSDLAGKARVSGASIDIGAYEFRTVPQSRIVRVKTGGNGDGSSWDTAMGDIQSAIDYLAENGDTPGEVWVAAGIYTPAVLIETSKLYTASFRMRDGISVYGGFAGTETSKAERRKKDGGMPWEYEHETVLRGVAFGGSASWIDADSRWDVQSDSRHVVWFAPYPYADGANYFENHTVLAGVTIEGGYAQGGDGLADFATDKGAGVFVGTNAELQNCIVRNNYATGNGGAVYLNGGRITSSLIANSSAAADGGAVYMDEAGLVLRSMLTNCSAENGAGVYLYKGNSRPEYLILSTSIVSNNTASRNGAVYCADGGVLLQNTMTNNVSTRATDATDPDAAQTGGLYIDGYALVINSVLWNNLINGNRVPMYARNPSSAKVRFMHTAVSGMNNAVWNNILQQELVQLSDDNLVAEGDMSPDFTAEGMPATPGVNPSATAFDYFWQPIAGSNLRALGLTLGTFPQEVIMAPELDIQGNLFAQKPSLGAFSIARRQLAYEETADALIMYVDNECTDPEHTGESWDTAYRSLNEALLFMAGLDAGTVGGKRLEIHVREGDLWPRYAFANLDPKTATLAVPATESGSPIYIYGGYSRDTGERSPLVYRSVINGNHDGTRLEDGLYHCITVAAGANVVLNGFHVTGGYAAGEATVQYGAGMLVEDGAMVELRNCVFDNNTAAENGAVDARGATLKMVNCLVNNNTSGGSAIRAANLTLQHVSIVNNASGAYQCGGSPVYENSFAAGNDSGNDANLAISPENFRNPTNTRGATFGYDTYLGGYPDFTPLTSSAEAGEALINKGSVIDGIDTDITVTSGRNLGGEPDRGAYEAALPESGRVYYVRMPEHDGNDSNTGLSWDQAFATVRKAVDAASRTEIIDGEKAQVWVAAGNYAQDPQNGSDNCFEIVEAVNVYGAFPNTGTPSMDDRRPFISDEIWYDNEGGSIQTSDYETILRPLSANYSVRRVLGQDDMFNPFANGHDYVHVGQGQGDYEFGGYYEDAGGDLIYSENGGEYVEADPSLCTYKYFETAGYYKLFTNSEIQAYSEVRDSGISQGPKGDPMNLIKVGVGYGQYTVRSVSYGLFNMYSAYEYTASPNGDYSIFSGAGYYQCAQSISGVRYYVGWTQVQQGYGTHLMTKPGWNYVGEGYGTHKQSTEYTYVGPGNGDYKKGNTFMYPTTWDGFTIRDGYIDSRQIRFLDNSGINDDDQGGGSRNGGAGVAIFTNVTIANCVIVDNQNVRSDSGGESRGGGVYCDEGVVMNCYVLNNTLGDTNDLAGYGGGVYMYNGTAYNCVIARNHGYARCSDGAGIFIETANFFNNTIVANNSHGDTRGAGGVCIWNSGGSAKLTAYNCISVGNICSTLGIGSQYGVNIGDKDVASNGGDIEYYSSISESITNKGQAGKSVSYIDCISGTTAIFNDATGGDYRINGAGAGSIAINSGNNEPVINGETYVLMDYTDMDFTDRIKDCTIDAGAYEFDNTVNTKPDANGIYYVTQNGAGNASGDSPENAACATKLQEVLDAAGERVAGGLTAIVKIAGYEGGSFTYRAYRLSDENDPQSYTFTVPYGVEVRGGYPETDFSDGARDIMRHKTVLSPVYERLGLTVNGYHVITFGEPGGQTGLTTVIDGLYLEGGKATSMSGSDSNDAKGGGAIVPAWGHVRNCVVRGNEAVSGGGLYLLAGATVSGTAVQRNTAENGGGIYADSEGADADRRAHVISCTVTDNNASSTGGGLYHEDGAAMALNTVVWGNTAPSDKNVSGVFSETFADNLLAQVIDNGSSDFYPYNYSFVETYEMPANVGNYSMTSNADTYFENDDRTLKAYSPLIKHGMAAECQKRLQSLCGVADTDMQKFARVQTHNEGEEIDRVDVGAFAFDGGLIALPESAGDVVTRLFVSQTANKTLREGVQIEDYLGRSFYTSFTWLDDALQYIYKVREKGGDFAGMDFEILVAEGTYKPAYQRPDAAADVTKDQRQNSFVIPEGVSVYGGFTGNEDYSCGISSVPAASGDIAVTPDGDINGILAARQYSDLNGNGVAEAWELAGQTILSGHLNVSSVVDYAYHVVYSSKGNAAGVARPVVIDGVTVMDGRTASLLSADAATDEVGRGGGIYSNGVPYVIANSRILNNHAVRGGGLYVRDAEVTLIGSVLASNTTVEGADAGSLDIRGGGAYVTSISGAASLKAVNTLWSNNESAGLGGAFAAGDGCTVSLMNNSIVRNKAAEYAVAYVSDMGDMTNTAIWGNECAGEQIFGNMTVNHSAAEAGIITGGTENKTLSAANMEMNGPRFERPSAVAGAAGNSSSARWNPASISLLTDGGDGKVPYNVREDVTQATGAYRDWTIANVPEAYRQAYMGSASYLRYAGSAPDEERPNPDNTIDIGLFEYQYNLRFSEMDVVYVDTLEQGNGDGSSWGNATSDLKGAISALANATGGETTDKKVFVRGGEYSMPYLSTGYSYILNMSRDAEKVTSLTIEGSYNSSGVQDLSAPTVIRSNPAAGGNGSTLMRVETKDKVVTIEGVTFMNSDQNGNGIGANVGEDGTLTMKNTAFRHNGGYGLGLEQYGRTLIVNTLFADGGNGLLIRHNGNASEIVVVNNTFANNSGADFIGQPTGIYNSLSWNNGTQNLTTDDTRMNVSFPRGTDNNDIDNGPNFVDPDNGDYRLRPGMTLLNREGTDALYRQHAGVAADAEGETDLAGTPRKVDRATDIGAYEYEAELRNVIYVKAGVVTGDGSGDSWANAVSDLQSAVNNVSIAVNGIDETGYVFVHNNVQSDYLYLYRPNIKVYGSMNDERGATPVEVLAGRRGLLEYENRSQLPAVYVSGENSVVDGFEVADAAVGGGMLSSSVITGTAEVNDGGILYNSFVQGAASGSGAFVNVTSTGRIPAENSESMNNYPNAVTNGYVADEVWKYQLKEDNAGIDAGGNRESLKKYTDLAGHTKDISGVERVLNDKADAGCFETWNIAADCTIGAGNGISGRHVVYVRKGMELSINGGTYGEGHEFNPGFLLLEHGAGLVGNGNSVGLSSFAVERELNADNDRMDLAAMPFAVTAVEGLEGVTVSRYDGAKRAAYDYKYDADNGAWQAVQTVTGSRDNLTEGWLLESGADAKVRFYGDSYEENGDDGEIRLMRYNYSESWGGSGDADDSHKMTHLENMSWNLFGSPFLCAMNYDDMEYGRVIYEYDGKGGYKAAVNTSADGVTGAVGAGSAVFTQTATLKEAEVLAVRPRTLDGQSLAGGRSGNLAVAVSFTAAGNDDAAAGDEFVLTAVPSDEARSDYDVSSDGVEMAGLDAGAAQIYMERGGGRYSLLSAVDVDGTVPVGLYVPGAGTAVIGLGGDCRADDYDTVVLTDALTGRTVDLKEEDYGFYASEAGDVNGRFSIQFNKRLDTRGGAWAYADDNGGIVVRGLIKGQMVRTYMAGGQMVDSRIAAGETETVSGLEKGMYLIQVVSDGREPTVIKIRLQ